MDTTGTFIGERVLSLFSEGVFIHLRVSHPVVEVDLSHGGVHLEVRNHLTQEHVVFCCLAELHCVTFEIKLIV